MSSDNTICVARFITTPGVFYWKVIHTTNIDACDYTSLFPQGITDLNRVLFYKEAPVFYHFNNAYNCAQAIYDDVTEDGGTVEYGICTFEYDMPLLNISVEEARKRIDKYYEEEQAKNGNTIEGADEDEPITCIDMDKNTCRIFKNIFGDCSKCPVTKPPQAE